MTEWDGPVGSVDQVQPAEGALSASLARLDGLTDQPLTEHIAAFDQVHVALRDLLATLDDA